MKYVSQQLKFIWEHLKLIIEYLIIKVMKYIKTFKTNSEYENAEFEDPTLSHVTDDNEIHCDKDKIKRDYVEIAGIKWATMNVGARNITDYGLYFLWGDTLGYTAELVGSDDDLKYFGWADYKYGNDTSSPGAAGMAKYNSTDGKIVLESSDDAVTVAWGSGWRMPTIEEFLALKNATTAVLTSNYEGSGVTGLVLTDKTDESKKLFFPACGACNNGSVGTVDYSGYYWSSSLSSNFVLYANDLLFGGGNINWKNGSYRYYGCTIRGVFDSYPTNGHTFVDLGLPSGTKWATMNIGASSETSYGNYYMYGKGATLYDDSDTPYTGAENPLDLSVDTARLVWGGAWHIPTATQCLELVENTTYQWITNYNSSGKKGGLFTALNGNTLFIPAAGSYDAGTLEHVNECGLILSSTPHLNSYAFKLELDNEGGRVNRYIREGYGLSVRPVIG